MRIYETSRQDRVEKREDPIIISRNGRVEEREKGLV